MSSGAEDGGISGTRSCASSGDSGGGGTPDDVAEVVGVGPVSSSTTKLTDRQLGGSGGANVHRRCRRSLAALHPFSSAVVLSGQRLLRAMFLRAAFLRWKLVTSFCRLSKKNFLCRHQDAVALVPVVLLCMGLLPPAKEEGGGVPLPMILLLLLLGRGQVDHA